MSLPKFDVQGSLFESLGWATADLFDKKDKYKLFARKIWPLLARVAKNWQNVTSLGTGDLESNR
jgi:hypothetical protein